MDELGGAIREARKARGWSPVELADACPLATLTPAAIHRIERGRESPGLDELAAIARALTLSVADLRAGRIRADMGIPISVPTPAPPALPTRPMLKIDTTLPPNAKKEPAPAEREDLTAGLGAEIAKLRQARGMKQSELGEKVELQPSTVSAIEGGRTRLTILQLLAIMDALSMDVSIKLVPRDTAA